MYFRNSPKIYRIYLNLLLALIICVGICESKAQQILNTRLTVPFGDSQGYQFISNNIRQDQAAGSLIVVFFPEEGEGRDIMFEALSNFTVAEKTSVLFLDREANNEPLFIELADSLKTQIPYYPHTFYLIGFSNEEFTSIPDYYFESKVPGKFILIENTNLEKNQLHKIPSLSRDNSIALISMHKNTETNIINSTMEKLISSGSCVENYSIEKVGNHPYENIQTDVLRAALNWIISTSCHEIEVQYTISPDEINLEPNTFKRGEYAKFDESISDIENIYLFDHKGNKLGEYITDKIHTYDLNSAAYYLIIKTVEGVKSVKFYVQN